MDEADVRRAWWDWPALVEAVAALAVGMAFVFPGLELPALVGFADLVHGPPIEPAALACALLVLGVSTVALLPRLPAWPLVVAALLVALATDGIARGAELVLTDDRPLWRVVTAVLAAVAVGLALGGVLLAVAQAPRSVRWLLSGGLAAGLVLQPASVEMVRGLVRGRESGSPVTAQLGFAALAAVVAAISAHRRVRDASLPAPGRPAVAPVVVVCAAGGLVVAVLAVRSSLVREYRFSPDSLSDHPERHAVQGFGHWSLVLLAVAVGVVLLGHAYRVGGVVAARWVLLCLGAGPVALFAEQTIRAPQAEPRYPIVLAVVAAVAAGAAFGRYAAGRAVPWDVLGLLVAAVAVTLATLAVRTGSPSLHPVPQLLTVAGLGLALAFGLSQAACGLPGPDTDTGVVLRLLLTGPAALVLSALALAPIVTWSISGASDAEPVLTIPGFVAATAVLLVLLLGFSRAVERFGRDLAAGPTSSPPLSPGDADGPTP
ncbi:hypothetical protein ABZ807_16100 [Micromonospora sp. NPDC047548]|uniref:hypothetical protein n=1 Tax=Micromonospora sp. NPDC047548 TaxID=3155624 RepID=UPI0033E6C8A0